MIQQAIYDRQTPKNKIIKRLFMDFVFREKNSFQLMKFQKKSFFSMNLLINRKWNVK